MDVVATAVFLATLGERLSEILIKPILAVVVNGRASEPVRVWITRVTCAIPGAVVSVVAGVNLFAELGVAMPLGWGIGLTALIVGLGANFVYEAVSLVRIKRGAYVA